MTADDDFNRVFGSRTANMPGFAQRLGRPAPDAITAPPTSIPQESVFGAGSYKPYGFMPAGVGETCDVQRWLDGTEIAEGIEFQYRFLMQIGYVGEEQIRLFLPDCIVVIDGRHLRDLRKKLARRQITFIQQFNPQVWTSKAEDEPVIYHIKILRE